MAPSYWEKFTNHIPSIFFHLTLRFTLLRIVCLTALLIVIANIVQKTFKTFTTYLGIFVFLHHFATTLGPRFSLPGGLDLALVLAEVQFYNPGLEAITIWDTKFTVLTGALAWTTTVSLAILAVLRIAEALKKGWSFLWKRYDITAPEFRHAWSGEPNTSGDADQHGGQNTKVLSSNDVLFGRSIWKSHSLGETHWIIISRGIFAAVLIVLISLFALFLVVLEPVRETALTPVKESRTVGFPTDVTTSGDQEWNVVIGKPGYESVAPVQFGSAVKVEVVQVNDSNTKCFLAGPKYPLQVSHKNGVVLDLIDFRCPMLFEDPGEYPDILVTVNFTMLNIAADLAVETRWNSVQVFLGSTYDPYETVRRTPPTSLIPGVNLIGFGQLQLRQQFLDPRMSAFGVFDSYKTFITSEMIHVWHDPRTNITRAPDVSTLRIVTPYNFAEWRIIQQSRDKSVLKGLASVGGLWTFLGGIFTALFGTTIMRIIFGTKPLSIFGLTRSLVGDKIKEACRTEYPRIESDLKVEPAEKGLIAFMADHLVDFDFLKDSGGHSSSHESATPLNTGEGKDESTDAIPLLPITNDTAGPLSSPVSSDKTLSV